jgi:excisionase family DNA binding protein
MKEVGFENPVTSRIAAPLVGVHYKTLERMARAGNVPATKIGKSWLFRLSALSTWFDTELPVVRFCLTRSSKSYLLRIWIRC